jgi:hypothetical protein
MIECAPTSNYMNYNNAILYCLFCNHNEHNDWRMPTMEEYKQYRLWGWYVGDTDLLRDDSLSLRSTVTPIRDI